MASESKNYNLNLTNQIMILAQSSPNNKKEDVYRPDPLYREKDIRDFTQNEQVSIIFS